MKLDEFVEVKGNIICKSGLRIGGTAETVGIGETDNPIIRHPITRLPYIPGSSLKGKLRSLLELKYGQFKNDGRPCKCGRCFVCSLFGTMAEREREPGRLIFRDCPVTEKMPEWVPVGTYGSAELQEDLPGSFVETKTEIAMNRKTGGAQRGALRQQERVPEGTVFDFSLSIRLFDFDKDNKKDFFTKLGEAFELLEKDYLGGSGTRGYGKVEVFNEQGKPMKEYLKELG